jgi:hypothetical protein
MHPWPVCITLFLSVGAVGCYSKPPARYSAPGREKLSYVV